MPKKYPYRAVCWKECYWKENLWSPGEIYEGEDPPGKYFHVEGEDPPEEQIMDPGSDPRPNTLLKKILKEQFGFKTPTSWTRRKIWAKLNEYETASSKDSATKPKKIEVEKYPAACGYQAKSNAGKIAHERQCDKCQELLDKGD